jgi:non-heme chloroperoxidase
VSRLALRVGVDVLGERLDPDIEASAYFILAEALTNVGKHARATWATVRAATDDGVLTLEVRDDGVGEANPDGHGLVGIATGSTRYDTFAADLNTLIERLDLRDVVLVGFSMGTGEVTRYLSRYGSGRVCKAAVIGAIPPLLLKREDNPEGVDGQVFEDMKATILRDRYTYFKQFLDNFYNVDALGPDRISEQAWQASFQVAAGASPHATYVCVDSWLTDFRDDLRKIDVPMLVVRGTADRILPIAATADRLPDLIADVRLVRVENGPHNIGWTHAEHVNRALLDFLGEPRGRLTVAA